MDLQETEAVIVMVTEAEVVEAVAMDTDIVVAAPEGLMMVLGEITVTAVGFGAAAAADVSVITVAGLGISQGTVVAAI